MSNNPNTTPVAEEMTEQQLSELLQVRRDKLTALCEAGQNPYEVTKYNVNAYISGKLETVDVDYLGALGSGATPYLQKLTYAEDPKVASAAMNRLNQRNYEEVDDFRDWNYADYLSDSLLLKE